MDIQNLEKSPPIQGYCSVAFQKIIEEHLVLIKNSTKNKPKQIDKQKSYVYRGDFYGLLLSMDVPSAYHYVNLRINGYTCPSEYKGEDGVFYLADPEQINLLYDIYRTKVRQ
jgi:hypothetical protein